MRQSRVDFHRARAAGATLNLWQEEQRDPQHPQRGGADFGGILAQWGETAAITLHFREGEQKPSNWNSVREIEGFEGFEAKVKCRWFVVKNAQCCKMVGGGG